LDHSINQIHYELIYLSGVLMASLIGSWHCAGMCGPIMTAVISRNKKSTTKNFILYHFGRLFIYSFLGFLAGAVGSAVLNSNVTFIEYTSGILIFLSLIFIGFKQVGFFKSFNLKINYAPFSRFYNRIFGMNAFLLGLGTALLPCGWLYSFVLLSTTTQRPELGALTMFFFWLGSMPALSFVQLALRPLHNKLSKAQFGWVFIILAFMSLGLHFYKGPHVHSHSRTLSRDNALCGNSSDRVN
jgi:uncharacterized protein